MQLAGVVKTKKDKKGEEMEKESSDLDKLFLSPEQAAEYAGVSKDKISELINRYENPMPYIQISPNRKRVCKSQIERFLMSEYGRGEYHV